MGRHARNLAPTLARIGSLACVVVFLAAVLGCGQSKTVARQSTPPPSPSQSTATPQVVGHWRPTLLRGALPGLLMVVSHGSGANEHELLVVMKADGRTRTVIWRVPKRVFIDCDPASAQLLVSGYRRGWAGRYGDQFLWLLAADGTVRLIAGPLTSSSTGIIESHLMADGTVLWNLYESTKGGYAHRTRLLYETSSGQRGEVTLRGADLASRQGYWLSPMADRRTLLAQAAPPEVALLARWDNGVLTQYGRAYRRRGASGLLPVGDDSAVWWTGGAAGRGITYGVVRWRNGQPQRQRLRALRDGPTMPHLDTAGPQWQTGPVGHVLIWGWRRGEHVVAGAVPLLLLDVRTGTIRRTPMIIRASGREWDWLWRWVGAGKR